MSACIEVKNVSKQFGGQPVLGDVSLIINRGTTVGLVGANGSGKSVLFKAICGMVNPDSGSIVIEGVTLGDKTDFPENMGVFINSPGFIGIYNGFKNLKFLANIRGVINDNQIREAMRKVGLDPDNKTKVDNYSLGMKQKLGLAQAIMENQEILVLDEPFNALDFQTYNDVKEIVRLLQAEGKTILLTSHNYDDIEQLCDAVYIIDNRKVVPVTEELISKYFNRK
ncbi:ABC transporter ATP-binding protein [Proteiniclasticum ruminis]|uniref:ABC transporter ATP-binding protein n=1 Tax=Proteiniclasticum ruminis TaxID=398199 RepID=UPI0028AD7398|nr:ABC transporter ATP-binding protein [Proteiniclasticum ruminis]